VSSPLERSEIGGPLLAVCGLAGGVGTTTLALLIARQAAQVSSAPVTVTESESRTGGMAELVGELESVSGPRVLAGATRVPANVLRADRAHSLLEELARLRAESGLVVVDCGTVRDFDARLMLRAATHVAWIAGADAHAVVRARRALDGPLVPPAGGAREALIGVAAPPGGRQRGRVRELRRLAESRCERLVLVPHVPELAEGDLLGGAAELELSLAGLGSFLRDHAHHETALSRGAAAPDSER
jgi:hypothetical protein